eukprot:7201893-Prymnesium_polylepis.1
MWGQYIQNLVGGGQNDDLAFRRERSVTEGVCGCRTTMLTPWAHVWGATKGAVADVSAVCSPPQVRLPAAASARATWVGV